MSSRTKKNSRLFPAASQKAKYRDGLRLYQQTIYTSVIAALMQKKSKTCFIESTYFPGMSCAAGKDTVNTCWRWSCQAWRKQPKKKFLDLVKEDIQSDDVAEEDGKRSFVSLKERRYFPDMFIHFLNKTRQKQFTFTTKAQLRKKRVR